MESPSVPRKSQTQRSSLQRKRSNATHDRDVHDDYEKQQHDLEAALEHYVTYGDSESLQYYLGGFKTSSESSDATVTAKVKAQSKSNDSDRKSEQPEEDCEQDQSQQNAPSQTSQAQKPQQKQQQHQPEKQQQQQPKQSEPAVSQPKKEETSQDTQPKSSTGEYGSINDDRKQDASNDNSIWGYTPPSFKTSSGPATVSLYAASSEPFRGHATFYATGLGACGIVNTDNQPIVAVSRDIFEKYNPASGNPNENTLCGRKLEITWNGKKQLAFAMDECPGCKTKSLDLSPSVFKALEDPNKGDLDGITWKFV